MSELEVQDQIVVEDDQQNLQAAPEDDRGDSDGGEQGGDTNSEMGRSLQSAHENSEAQDDSESAGGAQAQTDSQAPVSSRGSTRATGDDDSMSLHSAGGMRQYAGADPRHGGRRAQDNEPERDQYGHPVLTNRYLRELFRTEWKKYYRTPELNEKLFLHFKGFSKMQNLGQFHQLKCLYFEGNGCESLLGLEENTQLRSLFIQENAIRKMEGLDTLKELRQLNLNENFLTTIEGLAGCEQLDTLYLKRNRLGRGENEDVAALRGLLECPTLTCVDLSENDLGDPAILEEVIYRMPNLRVLYLQGNPVCRKIDHYRKKTICSIPNLKYLDDRPVFEEDRRRAEAWARGGMEEERAEMKRIKQEKEDKHWANHEAFQIMIKNAKKDREAKAQAVKEGTAAERKETMKEMMARAKAEKAAAGKKSQLGEQLDGEYRNDGDFDRTFFDAVAEKAEQRFQEKQAGVEHAEEVPAEELHAHLSQQRQGVEELSKEYDALEAAERLKPMPKSIDDLPAKTAESRPTTMQEMEDAMDAEDDDEEAPDLEEVDAAELEKAKQEKQKEWLDKVVAEHGEPGQICEKPAAPESKDEASEEEEDIDAILSDEKRVREAQAAVTADQIEVAMEEYAAAAQGKGPVTGTDFDELD